MMFLQPSTAQIFWLFIGLPHCSWKMDVAAAPWHGSRPAVSRPSWQPHVGPDDVQLSQGSSSRLVQLRVAVERFQDSLSMRLALLLDRLGDLIKVLHGVDLADQRSL